MTDVDIHGLAALVSAYAGFEYLAKRLLRKRIEKKPAGFRTSLLWGAILLAFLTILTAAHRSPVLFAGYVATAILYVVTDFMERRPRASVQDRSLEFYVVRQVLMGFALLAVWRISQPLGVGEWYVTIEQIVFGPADALRDYLHHRLPTILIILSCYFFAIDGGTRIVRGILRKFPRLTARAMKSLRGNEPRDIVRTMEITDPTTSTTVAITEKSEAVPRVEEEPEMQEEENVGEWIGIIERIIALTFVFTGSYAALGFAVAAKSIARFKELENKDFAEYFLLGTTGSLVSVIVAGLIARTILGL